MVDTPYGSGKRGKGTAAQSMSVVLATDGGPGEYETVAASQTDQVMGGTGGVGDYLSHILVVPATTSPGVVQIKDGAGSAITVFTGGAVSVASLVPFTIQVQAYSLAGSWKLTTGTNVSLLVVGDFAA